MKAQQKYVSILQERGVRASIFLPPLHFQIGKSYAEGPSTLGTYLK